MLKDNLKFSDALNSCVKPNHSSVLHHWLVAVVMLIATTTTNAAITDYNVTNPVPMGSLITIYGVSSTPGALCDFYIFSSDDNILADRYTSEYASGDGTFSTSKKITPEKYDSGRTYRATTVCGADKATKQFMASFSESQDYKALNSIRDARESPLTFLVFIVLGLFGLLFIYWIAGAIKQNF